MSWISKEPSQVSKSQTIQQGHPELGLPSAAIVDQAWTLHAGQVLTLEYMPLHVCQQARFSTESMAQNFGRGQEPLNSSGAAGL